MCIASGAVLAARIAGSAVLVLLFLRRASCGCTSRSGVSMLASRVTSGIVSVLCIASGAVPAVCIAGSAVLVLLFLRLASCGCTSRSGVAMLVSRVTSGAVLAVCITGSAVLVLLFLRRASCGCTSRSGGVTVLIAQELVPYDMLLLVVVIAVAVDDEGRTALLSFIGCIRVRYVGNSKRVYNDLT